MKIAVVGAGWSGLAAAVRATQAGHQVTLFEMSAQLGGRARGVDIGGLTLDNGQHILIGAYTRTLDLMRTVGSDIESGLRRIPLELRYPDGRGLRVAPGAALPALLRAVLGCRGWNWRDRVALLRTVGGWGLNGFRCDSSLSVAQLCRGLPPAVRELLIDPLCVAALNTPAAAASGSVFLRVLHDALFGGSGSADLLLPRRNLGALLPQPAKDWLLRAGARVLCGQRVQEVDRRQGLWRVAGLDHDGVVLACSATEAARLALPVAPQWAHLADSLVYEPIVTVYLHCPGARLPAPMMALVEAADAPAQFAFDHGALGASAGVFAFVVSGARRWVDVGMEATTTAVLRQATQSFPTGTWPSPPTVLRCLVEKRATFRCTPGLLRPPGAVAAGLVAAGDYVQGPYPATLEGAVRSGEAAVAALLGA